MTTWPAASTPWTWNTDLAISRPIVVIVCMFGSSKWWGLNSTHIHGTHVPVEEPSTASKAVRPHPLRAAFHVVGTKRQISTTRSFDEAVCAFSDAENAGLNKLQAASS